MESIAARLTALKQAPHALARAKWLRQWRNEGFHSDLTLADRVSEAVKARPDARLVFGSREHHWEGTIGEVHAEALRLARGLYAHGVREGEIAVLQVPNWMEGVAALLAAWELGLVIVPVVHNFGSTELGHIMRETQASTLIVPDQWKKIDYAARIAALEPLPELRRIVVIGEGEVAASVPVLRWSALVLSNEAIPPVPTVAADDPCLINFTSGSTAQPKAVVHSHQSFGAEIMSYPGVWKDRSGFTFLPAPGGHMAGLIGYLRVFLCHEETVFIDHWDTQLLQELLHRFSPEVFGGVPMQAEAMLATIEEWRPPEVLQMMVGGANVPPALLERAQALGIPGTRAYGLTEHPTVTGSAPSAPLEKRAYTDGCPTEGNHIKLVDDDGRPVQPGEPGEILTIGPELCLGYLDSVANAEFFDGDGWFRTGDIGIVDAEGYLRIVDRKKDIIIRGGENIAPKELEDILIRHPAVAEAAVVGWPDARYGERAGAFVRLEPGASLTLEDVQEHFRAANLLVYKTPEYLEIVEDFVRTPMGKILKPVLRKEAARILAARTQ